MQQLHEWVRTQPRARTAGRPITALCRPAIEALEDRLAPTVSTISSTFNGTNLAPGSTIWFNSIVKVHGLGSAPVTIHVDGGTITSSAFSVSVPDAVITFSPTATSASTTFDAGSNSWITTVPLSFGGNLFLAGVALPLPGGLQGGVKPVVWQANFTTDTPGFSLQWQWAAAAYTTFGTDYNALGVKPVDGSSANPYANSDHAGTAEAFKPFVVGGARGGGGSNFTGSYSATKALFPEQTPPPTGEGESSLSGFVYLDFNGNGIKEADELGIANSVITLTGTDDLGNTVLLTTETDASGFYEFTGLRAGIYTITSDEPLGFVGGIDTIGSLGGIVGPDEFSSIILGAGVNGVNYNFGELQPA
jgi:hypothetical protein